MRVDVEKALVAGESEENVRVSGEAYRRVPFGIADIMSLVVCASNAEADAIAACECLRNAETGT